MPIIPSGTVADPVHVNLAAGGGGGDASAENQVLQIILETALNTAIGTTADVAAASDTATATVLSFAKRLQQRLTSLLAVLPAALTGSGNFKTAVNEIVSLGHVSSATITRPATTPTYAINDVIGDVSGSGIVSFAGLSKSGGGEVVITSATIEVDVASSTIGPVTLHLYNASPTAIADDAAWSLVSGDRSLHINEIKFNTPLNRGATYFGVLDQIYKQVTIPSGGTLYGILTTDSSYTPAASVVKKITLHTLDV